MTLPKSTKQIKPYAGWSTLNKQDVLQTVSGALSEYQRNRPALKIRYRRYPEKDGETRWSIRSNSKSMCNICITETKRGGVRIKYQLADSVTKTMKQLMEHEAAQIHEYIKIRIDAVNNVGTHWLTEGLPKNAKIRLEWKHAWDEIQILQSERRYESEKAPTLQDIEDHLRYAPDESADNPPPFRKDTIAKIINAGEKGLLDNVKSR